MVVTLEQILRDVERETRVPEILRTQIYEELLRIFQNKYSISPSRIETKK